MQHFIVRLILVPLGFVLATMVSILTLITLGSERITHALQDPQDFSLVATYNIMEYAILLTSTITIVPALMIVILGEIARLRSIIYYIAGGGLVLGCIPLFAQLSHSGDISALANTAWPVFATAGFLGGFMYWLVAGRNV